MPDSVTPPDAAPFSRPSMVIHPDPESLALATATMVVEEARRGVNMRGRFTLALAGGSTPQRAYELLARPSLAGLVPWESVHVFWGDERCVDPADPRSNERMARETLLDHVPIPSDQVHPMRCGGGGLGSGRSAESGPEGAAAARGAAAEYDGLLRAFFPSGGNVGAAALRDQGGRAETGCDLVLLGIGRNGHTASLFPGSEVLREEERWAASVFVDAAAGTGTTAAGHDMWRITLTAPFINRAALVVFLASGLSKAEVVREVTEGQVDTARLPAQLIRPVNGRLCWYLDEGSAALLARRSPE